jgi:hypothetical protein
MSTTPAAAVPTVASRPELGGDLFTSQRIDKVIDLAREALNKECEDSSSREVLGLAEYLKWANTTGPERAEALNQARVYLPPGPCGWR